MLDVVARKPRNRLDQNKGGEREQESGFDEGRQGFHLGMAELMFLIGRFVRDPYREIGENGRRHIAEIMASLGENRQGARGDARRRISPIVISVLTAIEASAALSLSRWASFIDFSRLSDVLDGRSRLNPPAIVLAKHRHQNCTIC